MTLGSDNLVDHYEKYLGLIEMGWRTDADGNSMPFQVARFGRGLTEGVGFATLGLSGHALRSPTSGKSIRQELLILVREEFRDYAIPGLLQQVGKEALESGNAFLRGDVIGPRGELFVGSAKEAFYVTLPVYLPDAFATCETRVGEVVTSWLIPISHSEAHFVQRHGWNEFEDRLVDSDPDLTDVMRESIFK